MIKYPILLPGILCLLAACSPVKTIITSQYRLDAWSGQSLAQRTGESILVTLPEAVAGYQTEQMLYIKKSYELSAFAKNTWVGPPADMLFPLIVQSIQRTGYFHAVSSSANDEETDYRLDTQLLALHQNFMMKPSELNLTVKAVLTNVHNGHVIVSRIFHQRVRCPAENPYGGVVAANLATRQFTAELSRFIVSQVKHERMHGEAIKKIVQ